MITFLTTARHRYTVDGFRRVWGASLAHVVQVVPYERLFTQRRVPGGVYVFTDMDRLGADDFDRASRWYRTLRDAGATVLSDPARFVGRLDLLRELHRLGVNGFNAHALEELDGVRFPVFLRFDERHDGPRSDLIHDPATLDSEIERLARGRKDGRLIVVEYLDYREPDDRFYKYTHFRVGSRLMFGGMVAGDTWCRKAADDLDAAVVDREIRAASDTDHDERLMQCFELAGIEFGRIDYAIVDGRVQVFEINSNPDLGIPCPHDLKRWKVRSRCYQAINEVLWDLFQGANHDQQIETPGSFKADHVRERLGAWIELRRKRVRDALKRRFRRE